MKIAIVASPVTPLRPAQAGGAQAFVSDLALGLIRRGHAVTLFCAAGSDVPGVELFTVPVPVDAREALVMPGGRVPRSAPGVTAALRAMFGAIAAAGFDVVSQHAFDAPAFELGHGLSILHTLHLPPLVPAVVRAVGLVDKGRLATVSRSCQKSWQATRIEVPHILRNGIGELRGEPAAVDATALIAGRISPEKGIEDAIAAATAAGLRVTVAGAHYDPAYEVDLSHVDYMGSLPRDRLFDVMARSAVTVCAVRWDEPFGMVAAEAQMAGCPVAAYRRGAMPEVIEEGVSGFLAEPDDVDALTKAIKRCLGLDRKSVESSARRRLSLDRAIDRYEAVFQEIAR